MDELSSLLKDTWSFFIRHLVPICVLIIPFIVPLNIFYAVAEIYSTDDNQLFWLAMIPGMLIYPIYQAALILYIASVVSGDYFPRKQYYKLSIKLWLPLMLLYIITTCAVMVGLVLFIFPALIVMARITFSEFYCVLNELKPMASFSASWEATKEKQWIILGGLIAIILVTTVPGWGVEKVVSILDAWNPVFTFILGTIESILTVPLTIFGFRVFTLHQESFYKKRQGDE